MQLLIVVFMLFHYLHFLSFHCFSLLMSSCLFVFSTFWCALLPCISHVTLWQRFFSCFCFVLHLVNLNSFDVLPKKFFLTQIYDFSFVVSLDLLFFYWFLVGLLFVAYFLFLLCRCWHRFLCCCGLMFIYNIKFFFSIVLWCYYLIHSPWLPRNVLVFSFVVQYKHLDFLFHF